MKYGEKASTTDISTHSDLIGKVGSNSTYFDNRSGSTDNVIEVDTKKDTISL